VKRVFFGPAGELVRDEHHPLHDLSAREITVMAPLVILVFWMGLNPNFFLDYSKASLDHFVKNRDNYRLAIHPSPLQPSVEHVAFIPMNVPMIAGAKQ
jgi:NADH-quinone oxidoreductase subunit M